MHVILFQLTRDNLTFLCIFDRFWHLTSDLLFSLVSALKYLIYWHDKEWFSGCWFFAFFVSVSIHNIFNHLSITFLLGLIPHFLLLLVPCIVSLFWIVFSFHSATTNSSSGFYKYQWSIIISNHPRYFAFFIDANFLFAQYIWNIYFFAFFIRRALMIRIVSKCDDLIVMRQQNAMIVTAINLFDLIIFQCCVRCIID